MEAEFFQLTILSANKIKRMKKNIFFLFTLLALTACGSGKKKEKTSSTPAQPEAEVYTYINDEIGWSIDIPDGWTPISPEQMDAEQERDHETINDKTGLVVNDRITNLIGFSKSNSNNFKAFMQPNHDSLMAIINHSTFELNKTIIQMAEEKDLVADTSSGTENIGGYDYKYSAVNLMQKDNKRIFSQRSYYRIIGNYMFCANIMYSNEDDWNAMMSAFSNSKFKKPLGEI